MMPTPREQPWRLRVLCLDLSLRIHHKCLDLSLVIHHKYRTPTGILSGETFATRIVEKGKYNDSAAL
jgi:hypothetical protein